MKIERLRKSHKNEIIIGGLIALCIISAITFVTTRAKYRTIQELKLAKGTINYKVPDFKMVAMYQENDSGSYTEITEMPTSGYVVNQDKSYCTTDGTTQVKNKIKTENGKHYITSLEKNDKCYVWFDKKLLTISEIIATLNSKTPTPDFASASTTDEGVYKTEDKMYGGDTYYWRGAVTNNHVIFAEKCWRIIRINGDGTTRLIYNGTPTNNTCPGNGANNSSIVLTGEYNTANTNRSEYVGWTYSSGSQRTLSGTDSNAKKRTETWYNNIKGYESKIADGKFCNDRDTASGYAWSSSPSSDTYYASRGRLDSSKVPTTSCPDGDVYTLKAGAITADEVAMAGGKYDTANSDYYLYNGSYYWTMSPSYWGSSNRYAYMFVVWPNGKLGNNWVNINNGIRPVINLKSDVTFSSGDGTNTKPYIVS